MNLLLGAAINYTPQQLQNYILSFREYNKSDDIVILIDEKSKSAFEDHYSEENVKFELFDPSKYDMPIHNSRIFVSLEFLKNNPQYSTVLITDTRDVVFQSDPFYNLPQKFLYVFEEDSHVSISGENNNALWIEAIYGEDRYNEIADKNILCVGTLLGSHDKMIDLLEVMSQEILKIEAGILKHLYVDQVVLNHISYSDKDLSIQEQKNGNIVGTLAISMNLPDIYAYDDVSVRIRDKKVLVNGEIPAVLHQYDRNWLLTEMFNELYQR